MIENQILRLTFDRRETGRGAEGSDTAAAKERWITAGSPQTVGGARPVPICRP